MLRIKQFICPHQSHQILCLGKIDDIMRIPGNHMYGFHLFPGDFKAYDRKGVSVFIKTYLPFLNQTMSSNDDEQFPLRMMPMLSLGDTRPADIYGKLAVACRLQKLSKAASLIAVHF